jgi:hypothetical protein
MVRCLLARPGGRPPRQDWPAWLAEARSKPYEAAALYQVLKRREQRVHSKASAYTCLGSRTQDQSVPQGPVLTSSVVWRGPGMRVSQPQQWAFLAHLYR